MLRILGELEPVYRRAPRLARERFKKELTRRLADVDDREPAPAPADTDGAAPHTDGAAAL